MIKYMLRSAIRNFLRNQNYSIINLVGLSVGIAAAIIMILYAVNELSYNSNHRKAKRIYMVYKERHLPTGIQITRDTWFPMARTFQEKYTDVEEATHLWNNDAWVQVSDRKFKIPVTYAMQNIFDVFTFPLERGNPGKFLRDPHTAIIDQTTAEKLFGQQNPIGKTITVDFNTDYIVGGVFARIPANSTYRPEIMLPSNSVPSYNNIKEYWGSSWLDTYILLKPGADRKKFESSLQDFVKNNMSNESAQTLKLKLTALPDLHNEITRANIFAYILLVVAFAILLIACVNFINLSIAKSLERAREIGIQKVLGASGKELIIKYLSESMLISFMALFAGVVIAEIVLPAFNRNFDKHLTLQNHGIFITVTGLLFLGIFTGLTSGLYPAWVITKFQSIKTLAGRTAVKYRGFSLRNGLIVFQFMLTVVLLIATSVMLKQIHFMKNADLNIKKSDLIIISAGDSDFPDQDLAKQKLESFKSELRKYAGITSVTSSSRPIPAQGGAHVFVYPNDRPEEQRLREQWMVVDENFFNVYGIRFLKGRNFSPDLASDKDESVIVNQAALKDIGWNNMDEGRIRVLGKERKIIGVVEDYNYQSLESGIEPMIHIFGSPGSNAFDYITARLAPGNKQDEIHYISEKWEKIDPSRPLPFRFVNDSFNKLYKSQENLAAVGEAFTIIAFIISCMGLIALSAFILTYRTKEVGIRKVFGASVSGITIMLTTEFIRWVLFANLIAWPLSYYILNKFLQNFAYRTSISLWIFIFAGAGTILIAAGSVSFQSVKTARSNPVKSLRCE